MTTPDFEPELAPPSAVPTPAARLNLTEREYLIELARRIDDHATRSCIGSQAKREIGYAAMVLRMMAREIE